MGPLSSLFNYLVPASGNTSGYSVANPPDSYIFDPSQISNETGQLFVPSGVVVQNKGSSTGTLKIMPLGLEISFPGDAGRMIPFPALEGQRFAFTGMDGCLVIFVDYPVIPFNF